MNDKIILFDVGANDGQQWFNELSADQENTLVYMFEPNPSLCDIIKNKYKFLKNWNLYDYAVSNYNGVSQFYITDNADRGCSSLMKFRDGIEKDWHPNYFASGGNFEITSVIDVSVITLEQFMSSNNIPYINNLHIDSQGSDLNVLRGLGEYIKVVHAGDLEAGDMSPLYESSPHKDECIEWLVQHGFKITNVTAPHLECNIYFEKL